MRMYRAGPSSLPACRPRRRAISRPYSCGPRCPSPISPHPRESDLPKTPPQPKVIVHVTHPVIPSKSGIQRIRRLTHYAHWIPACAGMTQRSPTHAERPSSPVGTTDQTGNAPSPAGKTIPPWAERHVKQETSHYLQEKRFCRGRNDIANRKNDSARDGTTSSRAVEHV